MLIGIDNVIHWLESNQTAYWHLKTTSGEKSSLICSAQRGEEHISVSESAHRLRDMLNRLGNGTYFIQAWDKPGQLKGWMSSAFQITGASFNTPPPSGVPSSLGSTEDFSERLRKEMDAFKKELQAEQEKKDMQKEIAELKKQLKSGGGSGGAMERIAERIAGILPAEMLGFNDPEKRPVSQVSGGNQADDGERIGSLMEAWASADPNFEQTLQGIVRLARENPSRYNMGKNFLK